MKIVCTICMRKGSKGVTNKNSKIINGQPLMYYTIKQAIRSKIFDEIVVSTDSKKIQKIVSKFGIKNFFLRPKNLSGDSASKIDVIKHAVVKAEKEFNKKYDLVFDLDVTSPLRETKDILQAYQLFKKNKANNLISVCEARRNPYFNQVKSKGKGVELVIGSDKKIKRRQDAPKIYDMNASIYIWKREYLFKSKTLFGRKTSMYIMPFERSIDIDSYSDLKLVSLLLN